MTLPATMKALVYHGPGNISLDDVPTPQLLKDDDPVNPMDFLE